MNDVIIAASSLIVGLMVSYFFTRWNRETISPKQCSDTQAQCKVLHEAESAKYKLEREAEDARYKVIHDYENEQFMEFKRETRQNFGIVKGMLFSLVAKKEITTDELKALINP